MLAVQRQTPFPIHIHHARVQPTKTPGLLSLSKPSSKRPLQQRSSPKPKHHSTPTPAAKTHSAVLVKPFLNSTPPPRGRTPKTSSSKRSTSPSSTRNRRSDRQPSPPPALLFQEKPAIKNRPVSPTTLDPFLVDDVPSLIEEPTLVSNPTKTPPPARKAAAPTLNARPSGKLAKRRQPSTATASPAAPSNPSPQPQSKAAPVPVPRPDRRSSTSILPISRSQPDSERLTSSFPICDDSDDADMTDSSPVTPVRSKAKSMVNSTSSHARGYSQSYAYDNGPRTAPLFSTFPSRGAGFPFQASPSPSPRGGNSAGPRKHKRMPSMDNVFHMSDDDTPDPMRARSAPAALLSLWKRDDQKKLEAADLKALKDGFFASSRFQNSPSPEELPPPSF